MNIELFKKIFMLHRNYYPLSEPQDIYKMIYQGVYAGGHLINSIHTHKMRLLSELRSVCNKPTKDLERISSQYYRIYLDGLLETPLSVETLERLILMTADNCTGNIDLLESCIDEWKLIDNDKKTKKFISEIKRLKYPLVSHSDKYRQSYQPAYRIISFEYAFYFKLFQEIDRLLGKYTSLVIAIDGDAASGKSFLADLLDKIYDTSVIHMDDFFLPNKLRTKERLSEVGGNIDYDRFAAEVTQNIKSHKPFIYQKYNCETDTFNQAKHIDTRQIIIVEGSYSLHPKFNDLYQLKIFLKIDKDAQLSRLLKRNNKHLISRFIDEWIPMERAFNKVYQIETQADFVFDTTNFL